MPTRIAGWDLDQASSIESPSSHDVIAKRLQPLRQSIVKKPDCDSDDLHFPRFGPNLRRMLKGCFPILGLEALPSKGAILLALLLRR